MSLCLALLLTVVAINWWHGWKPFTQPFQMPGNQWLKRLSTPHRQRRRSSRRSVVDAREPPSTPWRLSPTAGDGTSGRVREGVSTFDLADDGRK